MSLIKVACRSERLWFWCPGCDDLHSVTQDWSWDWPDDDDTDNVTVSPSILVRYDVSPPNQHLSRICHSFLRGGRWEFLGDCTHALAGQTVDMVTLPDWFVFQDKL